MGLREDIAEELIRSKSIYVNTKKPFKFTSGRLAPVYVDCRRLISLVSVRKKITAAAVTIIREQIGKDKVDVIAGGETAGIPYAAFLAHELGLPMVYVRKEKKVFGGTRQVEGILEKGQRVLLFEDLITDGGSKLNFRNGVLAEGALMNDCIVVFEYACKKLELREGREMLEKAGMNLYSMADWDVIFKVALEKKYFTQEEVDEVTDFLSSPAGWGKRKGFTDKEI